MKNKKGFTLVEVLAVIVVLALLLVLAVPKILNVVENSDKNAFKSSVESLVKTVEMEYQNSSDMDEVTYEFPDNDLNVDGDKPSSGTISIEVDSNGNYMGVIVNDLVSKNGKWCASKRVIDKEVVIGKYVDNHCIVNYLKVGDYVKMLPISYNITLVGRDKFPMGGSQYTGGNVSSIQLNPSNIDLWRVIKVNDDNTIDMVSEYVTDETGRYNGRVGYYYYNDTLKSVAKQYKTDSFVQSTRYMTLDDSELVKSVYGTLKASTKDGTYSPYFINESGTVKRKYAQNYYYYAFYKYINASGSLIEDYLAYGTRDSIMYLTQSYSNSIDGHFRPIVTLESDLNISSGDGSIDYPYELVIEEE